MAFPVVPGQDPRRETAPLMQKWRSGEQQRIVMPQRPSLRAKTPEAPNQARQGLVDAANAVAGPDSFLADLGRNSKEVLGNIVGAPSVGQGIGRAVRTIGQGYAGIGKAIGGLAGTAQEVGRDVLAGITAEPRAPVVPIARPTVSAPSGSVGSEISRGQHLEGPAGEAGFARQLTNNGVRYEAPGGNYLEGRGTGGGTFTGLAGRASDTPGYEQMSNDQRIAANVAAMDRDREAIASLTKLRRDLSGGPGGVVTNAPTAEEAALQYARGEVGGQGYNMMRNLRVGQNAEQDLAAARAKNLASGFPKRYRAGVIEASLGNAGNSPVSLPATPRTTGPDYGDQIAASKLGLEGADLQRKTLNDQIANARAAEREKRESQQADTETQGQKFEQQQNFFKAALDTGAPSWLQNKAWAYSGGNPSKAMDILNRIVNDPSFQGNLEEATPEQQNQMDTFIRGMARQ